MLHSTMMAEMSADEFYYWAAYHKMKLDANGTPSGRQSTQQSPESMIATLKALSKGVPPKSSRAKR